MLSEQLGARHDALPVHGVDEIVGLAREFPSSIRLVTAECAGEIHAGVVLFISTTIARCQYIASDEFARANGLLDAVFEYCLSDAADKWKYFDFGTSMDPHSDDIATSLLEFKEGFGARTVVYDHYRLQL